MGNFFGGTFFSGGFFGDNTTTKTGTGGIDPKRKKSIYKPTGLTSRRKTVEDRIEETEEIALEIKQHFPEEIKVEYQVPIKKMSLVEIEQEISYLIRKNQRSEEEEVMLLLLLTAMA